MSTRARTAIACFGEALIDFLAEPAIGDAPRRFIEHAGGAPANVAIGVARLGGDARFVGMLSQDMFGDTLLAQFARHGVDVAQVRRTAQARTALAFVSLAPDGERSFNFYRPPAADLLFRVQDFVPSAFASFAAFHACSNSLTEPGIAEATLHGMRLATQAGALVSFDANLRPALWPAGADPLPQVWQALELAHVVKLSRDELRAMTCHGGDDAVVERLFAGATQVVLVTDGASPIRWWTRATSGTAPTLPVDAVDTTAAGDAFVAGLLQGLVERGIDRGGIAGAFDDETTRGGLLRQAAACGALAATRLGAFAAMPARPDVQALMERCA